MEWTGKVYLLYPFTPFYFPPPLNIICPDLFCKKDTITYTELICISTPSLATSSKISSSGD
jgi:hypothetical protein